MRASRILTLLFGIAMIACGIYCLFTPVMTYMTLGYIVGVNMVIDALGGILTWSDRKKAGRADGWTLAGAIASLIFGIGLITSTALQLVVDMTIVYIAAAWLVILGIIRIIHACKLHKVRKALDAEILGRRWWLILLIGILMVAGGIFSFVNPTGLIVAIGINFGLNIIVAGANLIAVAA